MRTAVQHPQDGAALGLRDRVLIAAGLFLAMLLAGVQLARATEAITVPVAVPSTTAYHFSSHPMISGTVVTVNDHQMVVETDQGERVTLEVDTRTMLPRDLAPGTVMRAEFLALEDCRMYAQRIMPVRSGMSTDRLQAYANSRAGREPLAQSASAPGGYRWKDTEIRASAESWASLPRSAEERSPGSAMTAIPTTADYQFSTRPMLSGRVVSVNDHRLVVETAQGQQVGMVMDSRTMVPGEVAPGTIMRAEFTQMKDGRYYAKRISRSGSDITDREQAYAHTRDTDLAIAGNTADCGFVSAATGNTVTSALERRDVVPATVIALSAPVPVAERPKTLPQTASDQPLILLLGLLALGSAGLVTVLGGVTFHGWSGR